MTTQDFEHGVDFTGITECTPALLNQLVDFAIPISGKGIVLCSTDTAVNVPDVPNATINTKWKSYVWVRIPHASSTSTTPILYAWNDNATNDTSTLNLLKWIPLIVDLDLIEDRVLALETDSVAVTATANTALTNSANAQDDAALALQNTLNLAGVTTQAELVNAGTVISKVSSTEVDTKIATNNAVLKTKTDSLDARITSVETAVGVSPDFSTRFAKASETVTAGSDSPTVFSAKDTTFNAVRLLNKVVSGGNLISVNDTTGEVTLATSGKYAVYFDATLWYNPNSTSTFKYQLCLYINSTVTAVANSGHIEATTNVNSNHHTSGMAIITCAAGDKLTVVHHIVRDKNDLAPDGPSGGKSCSGIANEVYANLFLYKLT